MPDSTPKYINVAQPDPDKEFMRTKGRAKISIGNIEARLITILYRESRALLAESLEGKLKKSSAEDLARYAKLIKELKAEQKKEESEFSVEQLQGIVGDSEKT